MQKSYFYREICYDNEVSLIIKGRKKAYACSCFGAKKETHMLCPILILNRRSKSSLYGDWCIPMIIARQTIDVVYLFKILFLYVYFLGFFLSKFPIILIFFTIDLTDKQSCCAQLFNLITAFNMLSCISINLETLILLILEN